ncbi:MAG TPA: DUF5671 domain-containing protein [Bryobacteraceae bacterium]|jgi:hypothetical protein|nr:DUF5671 domain-containing protein [Bryobacteraceae bacterium]
MPIENQPLLDFIDAVKSQGASDESVVALLRQNGWSERRIYQAFGAWYEARTGKAIPSGGGRIEAARDAFLYLLAFITLGIWTVQLGALLFASIDRAFPNRALDFTNISFVSREMADELASIIVGFPVFLLVTWWIVRGVQRQPERLESSVRKWLTYVALVITASTMIADIVTFLAYFLRGDLDTRFVLKVVTVLVIAGGVFIYYLDSLRSGTVSSSRNRWFAIAALAMAGFGVVVGFVETGSPTVQRYASQDRRRLYDLSTFAQALQNSWHGRGQREFALPATLQDVQKMRVGSNARSVDPVTGQSYEYAPLQGTAYRLCATFSLPSPADIPSEWQHPTGRTCFSLDASQYTAMVLWQW